jgi:ubiquinone/menaquinone biosynthesis C-methylase UbiE
MKNATTRERQENFAAFDADVGEHGQYLYTNNAQLSCQLATQRQRDAILALGRFMGRSVIDIGCGDGFNTINIWDGGHPRAMTGIDPAPRAIDAANAGKGDRPLTFAVADAHDLPFPDRHFDLAVIQGVLHHDDDAQDIIREAFRVAPEVLVLEPNGNNLVLKLIEKLSPYHRTHHEKSYRSGLLRRWVKESGGTMVREEFAGLVPIFCPDWFARLAKRLESVVELLPVVRVCGCAVYVFVARRAT